MFFKVILPNGEIHLLSGTPTTFDELYKIVVNKFQDQLPNYFSLRYKDSDEELVLMTGDDDFQTAVASAEAEKLRNLRIVIKKEEKGNYLSKSPAMEDSIFENKKQEKAMYDAQLNDIPLTTSLTDMQLKDTEESLKNTSDEKAEQRQGDSNLPPWNTLAGASESISNFCSPIDESMKGDQQRFLFDRAGSLETDLFKNETVKHEPFSKEQMEIISQLIEKSVNKNLMEKLENIMNEAIGGDILTSSRYSQGLKKTFPHNQNMIQANMTSPFGMRMSTKRCKDLVESRVSACCECKEKIDNVRFSCLTCRNYDCCEKCENNVEHPHPLLKIKNQKGGDGALPPETLPTLIRGSSRSQTTNPKPFADEVPRISVEIPSMNHLQKHFPPLPTETDQPQHKEISSPEDLHKPLDTCEIENFKRYKVTVIKEPIYDVIRVKARRKYVVDFTIKNTGRDKWPNEVCFICTQGIHKGHEHKIPSLAPGKEYNVILELEAPGECGRYLSQWKLHYWENEVFKSFGKVTYVEIDVSPADKENLYKSEDLSSQPEDHKGAKTKSLDISDKDQELFRETGCSDEALSQAKILNDMFPGDLKEKVEFIQTYPSVQNVNDLVSGYLDRLSNSSKRRGPGGSHTKKYYL